MKKILNALMITLGLAAVVSLQSCGNKTPEDITPSICDTMMDVAYNDEVKAIINNGCAYSGCHDGSLTAGVFSTYEGMKGRLDNGFIMDRMFNKAVDAAEHMPPPYATTGPTELTQEELDIVQCWLLNNYPEN